MKSLLQIIYRKPSVAKGNPVVGEWSGCASRFGAMETRPKVAGAKRRVPTIEDDERVFFFEIALRGLDADGPGFIGQQRDVIVTVEDGQDALPGFAAQLHVSHQGDAVRGIVQRDGEQPLAGDFSLELFRLCRQRHHGQVVERRQVAGMLGCPKPVEVTRERFSGGIVQG